MKVFCRNCVHFDSYFGDDRFYESCSVAKRIKTDDTYLMEGWYVRERPSDKNKNNNCTDYEAKK